MVSGEKGIPTLSMYLCASVPSFLFSCFTLYSATGHRNLLNGIYSTKILVGVENLAM